MGYIYIYTFIRHGSADMLLLAAFAKHSVGISPTREILTFSLM